MISKRMIKHPISGYNHDSESDGYMSCELDSSATGGDSDGDMVGDKVTELPESDMRCKKISNDQELIQSDPSSSPKTKREITKYINWRQFTKGTRGKPNEQLYPYRWSFSYLKFTKYVTNIIAEPKYKYGQQEQVTVRNHNRSTALERSV